MEFVTRGAAQLLVAENFPDGIVKTLEASLGIKQVGWRDTINARLPNMAERAFFDLSDKVQVAMVEFRRVSYDEDGKPIRITVTVYPADRNTFQMGTRAGCRRRRHLPTIVPGNYRLHPARFQEALLLCDLVIPAKQPIKAGASSAVGWVGKYT